MNKVDYEYKFKRIRKVSLVLLLVLVVLLSISLTYNIYSKLLVNAMAKESVGLIVFSGEVSQYCAEKNNMTLKELMNEYIKEVKVPEILEEGE